MPNVTLTLSNGTTAIVRSEIDQILQLIEFFFANPGHTGALLESEMTSFRLLEAQYGEDRDTFAELIGTELANVINTRIPEGGFMVEVLAEDVENEAYHYMLTLRITKAGVPVISEQQINVSDNEIEVIY